jgi:type IV pilus assembly protein PilY1
MAAIRYRHLSVVIAMNLSILIHSFRCHFSLFIIYALGISNTALAAISQKPLLTRSGSTQPNVLLIFDNSGSMAADYLYQYSAVKANAMGNRGPENNDYSLYSPDCNRLAYDPRILYKVRVNAHGQPLTYNRPNANTATFIVYFYKRTKMSTLSSLWDNSAGTNDAKNLTAYFTSSYTPSAAELISGATKIAYPNMASKSIASYPKWTNRTDCAGSFCTWSEELNNYAKWQAFHSTRMSMTKTGIGLAFQNFDATLRMGWATIDSLADSNDPNVVAGVSLFDGATKGAFYDWLYGVPTNGSTPNRIALYNAGKYFSRRDSDGPWGSNPNAASTSVATQSTVVSKEKEADQLTCRRSYNILVTDGYYNDDDRIVESFGIGNADGIAGPDITLSKGARWKYKPGNGPLFRDSHANTMADIVMNYWARDLRPDLDNEVPATSEDESQWQNLRFYGVNLGLYGTLQNNPSTIAKISAGTLAWPKPIANEPSTMDDLLHATINGHGKLIEATNTDSLTSALQGMIATINKVTNSTSGVAISTASLKIGTRKYTPRYTTGSWVGNVVATNIDPATGIETGVAWQISNDTMAIADQGIPEFEKRTIYVGTSGDKPIKAVDFTYTAMNVEGLLNTMDGSIKNTQAINYLRADASLEQPNGSFRARSNRLGDIVNSSPVFIKGAPSRENTDTRRPSSPKLFSVQTALAGTGQTYTNYLSKLNARTEGVLFTGANDGMLHAFRDGTIQSPTSGGKEFFAYVPYSVLPTLHYLTQPTYEHRYYVDGPNVETDGYWADAWHQVLLGGTGAGAKSIFALDVTEPLPTMNASNVLWEVTQSNAGFTNLGSVLWDAQSGALSTGQWSVIVGNGYESANGVASLFIIDMRTGVLIKELPTPAGPWTTTVDGVKRTYKNGLGGVSLVRDATGQRVLGAYAGDLMGNVWRFDLSNKDSVNWSVSLLFNTGKASPSIAIPSGILQPITAPPSWVINPAGGRIVVIGTGKFYEDTDILASYATQTIYGLADKTDFNDATIHTLDKGNLVPRMLSHITGSTTYLQLLDANGEAPGVIDWAKQFGWYINLPFSGQRVVYPMEKLLNRNSRIMAIDTISPANIANTLCKQSGSGTGWALYIDALYGADPGRAPDLHAKGVPDKSIITPPSTIPKAFIIGFTTAADGRNTTIKIDSASKNDVVKLVTISGASTGSAQTSLYCQLLSVCVSPSVGPTRKILRRTVTPLFLRM